MLEKLNLDHQLSQEEYETRLLRGQLQLRELAFQLYSRKRSLVVVYEGWDAAGKGGNIRRVTEKLDPRGYEVLSIAAPAGEDKTHHYLYRFWRRLKPPDEKQVMIFDRSWYGRVLVERVEGFCSEAAWKRAFREINDFERQLTEAGTIVAKFWIHISKEEQLRRFGQRADIALQALEAHRRGLAQPRKVGPVFGSRRGYAAQDQHPDRALDRGRGRLQVVGPREVRRNAGQDRQQASRLQTVGADQVGAPGAGA